MNRDHDGDNGDHLTLEAGTNRLRRLGLYGLLAHAQALLAEPWLARVIDIEEAERTAARSSAGSITAAWAPSNPSPTSTGPGPPNATAA